MADTDKYVCLKLCYVGSLCRPGDVVSEEVAMQIPEHFSKLRAKSFSAIQNEIELKVPEIAELNGHVVKTMTASELRGKSLPPIVGAESEVS